MIKATTSVSFDEQGNNKASNNTRVLLELVSSSLTPTEASRHRDGSVCVY